jgi:hypothetical protein
MIPANSEKKLVRVGHWHHENAEYKDGYCVKAAVRKVRFDGPNDLTGLLYGFCVEQDGNESCCVALVEKPDGTFATPSVTVIQLLNPTTLSGPA